MIDSTLSYIIDYFSGVLVNLIGVAMDIGKIMALVGIIWTGFQMAAGTIDTQKFLVGTITRFAIFFLIMEIYTPGVNGLLKFATSVAERGSPKSIDGMTNKFVSAMQQEIDALESMMQTNVDQRIKELREEKKADLLRIAMAGGADDEQNTYENYGRGHEIDQEIASLRRLPTSSGKKIEAKLEKKVNALNNILEKQGAGSFGESRYALKLDFKDKDGKSTGFLSPDALLNLAILAGDVMIENELAFDVYRDANEKMYEIVDSDEKAKEQNKKRSILRRDPKSVTTDEYLKLYYNGDLGIPLNNVPFAAFVRYLICWVCVIGLICTTIAGIIQYLMGIAEFFITTSVSVILVPMVLFDGLKDYATRILATLFGQVLKLIIITLMMYFCVWTFMSLAIDVVGDTSNFGVIQLARVLFTGFMMFVLTSFAPSMAQTIASGSPQMSMGEFVRGAASVAGGVAAARMIGGKAVRSGAGVSRAVSTASLNAVNGARIAKMNGKNMAVGALSNSASAIGKASRDAWTKYMGASEASRSQAQKIHDVQIKTRDRNVEGGMHQQKMEMARNAHKAPSASGMGQTAGTGSPDKKSSSLIDEPITV